MSKPEEPAAGNADPTRPPGRDRKRLQRGLGVPWLFATVYSSVGFSIYFALGVVADRGLGLTPLIFLVVGLLFVLTTLSYVEGSAMFPERGGSSSFARHAFNELIAFIAGWAILIDYLIIIALAAISVPHYLEPISSHLADPGWEVGIATAVIISACVVNALDLTGRKSQYGLAALALADLALQVAVIVVGIFAVWHPDRLADAADIFGGPGFDDVVYSGVLAMLAYAGIEAASDLAPDVRIKPGDLKRIVTTGALTVPLIYAGMAAIALMAVPVVAGPNGAETALGSTYVEAPVLGVVSAYDPGWLADVMRWGVALVAAPVLIWATSTTMLGVSRHIYTLAVNRQIPSWLGRLSRRYGTPTVAIWASGAIAVGLVVPTDVKLLAGIYAFGALLAITIAHLSILRLRITEPDRARPFKVPFPVRFRGAELPLPAILAALVSFLAFVSVLVYHDRARWVGGGWMLFGLVAYFVYRRLVEGTSLTERVTVTAQSLTKQAPIVEFRNILVPIFGSEIDDDIVGTAGRLAAADGEEGGGSGGGSAVFVIYVAVVPLKLPLDAPLPKATVAEAETALARAREVAEEYEDLKVTTKIVPARQVGTGILRTARELNAEAIVMGGESPSKIRGGAILGGVGEARPAEIGPATEYVLKKSPIRVLLMAPREGKRRFGKGSDAKPEVKGGGAPPA